MPARSRCGSNRRTWGRSTASRGGRERQGGGAPRPPFRGFPRRGDHSAGRDRHRPRTRRRDLRSDRGKRLWGAGPRRRALYADDLAGGIEAHLRRQDWGRRAGGLDRRLDDAAAAAAQGLFHGLRDVLLRHPHREPAPDRGHRPRAHGASQRGGRSDGPASGGKGHNRSGHRAPALHPRLHPALEDVTEQTGSPSPVCGRRGREAPDEGFAKRAFVLVNTRLMTPPLVPEVRLRLADEAVPIWTKTEEELGAMGLPPPFWAFAWAGGQALARYVLDNPSLARGERTLDFASGSGLVAIAAALAGAAETQACDIDAFAVAAIEINAAENCVAIAARHEDLVGRDEGWDVVLAGDVAYEKDMARAVTDWLASLARRGATVLVGDPRRTYLALDRLESVVEYRVPVTRELEDSEIKRTGVFRFRSVNGG